jgi:hypothetical protein
MNVTLPNGRVIRNVPEGTSKEEIKKKAIQAGLADASDFPDAEEDTLLDFLDVGTGLAGALGGAAAGTAVAGPVGTVIGGVVGGAIGTFGGEVAEDVIANEEINLENAAEQAAEGALIDVAMLGLGKVVRPLSRALGISTDKIVQSFDPSSAQAFTVGSKESLQQTEQLLRSGGGGLSAIQTGRAGKIRSVGERLGNEGILSSRNAQARIAKNQKTLQSEIQRQIDGIDPSFAMSIDDVGKEIYDIVNAGRNATIKLYGNELNKIIADHGTKQVSTIRARTAMDDFEKEYLKDFGSALHEETITQLNSIRKLFEPKIMSVDSMIEAQKIINRKIMEAGDIANPRTYNSTVERELTQLSSKLGEAITGSLGKIADGKVARDYSAAQKFYKDSLGGILPEINKNIISAAKIGDYTRLGQLLIKDPSQSKVDAMMNSIDQAFKNIDKSALKGTVKTAREAKKIIRQSYVSDVFKKIVDEGDIASLANKAKALSGPTETKRLKSIMGEDYAPFKALLNAISESSEKTGNSLFSLALRSREAGLLSLGGAGGTGAFFGGATGAIAGVVAILAVPEVLGRLATNPKAVAKLLDLEKQFYKNPNLSPDFVASAITKIIEDFDENDKASLRAALD